MTRSRRARTGPAGLHRSATARAALLVGLVFTLACTGAGSPDATAGARSETVQLAERLAAAPIWVTQGCRAHWSDAAERRRVVCGVGSAPPNRDRMRARETAVARARSEIARSLQVTIENMVRTNDRSDRDDELETIVHQLSSASLRGCQVRSVWRSRSGEVHALVFLDVDRLKGTARDTPGLAPAVRQRIEERAADAFAELDARFSETSGGD